MKRMTLIALIGMLVFPLMARGEIQANPTELSEQETLLVEWIQSRQMAMLKDLERYVNINTGTFNVEGLNHFRNLLEAEFNALGFETAVQPGGEMELLSCKDRKMVFADHLLARRTGKKPTQVFLNGHLDTVFPKDDEFQTITLEADGTLKGPGVLDMKGGLVAMKYALNALYHHERLQEANLTIFLNTDCMSHNLDTGRQNLRWCFGSGV
ncbi:MAG: M20/M25/M40 family metallo-hydrolase [Nitrospirota bacterium]|nr:M20/M25/M40 family metallo-hydrolase [Nitrospirota bacterium]MDH5574239.1 M20/M25/M40 family metallo-hydrolase [Nitrospirota bacterium]